MIRLTVPSMAQVAHISEIRRRLREAGCDVPIVADVHFSSDIAIAVASQGQTSLCIEILPFSSAKVALIRATSMG